MSGDGASRIRKLAAKGHERVWFITALMFPIIVTMSAVVYYETPLPDTMFQAFVLFGLLIIIARQAIDAWFAPNPNTGDQQ